ncbi:MAG: hypothetical protein ACI9VR_002282 [Cognaticolwellia sp.]
MNLALLTIGLGSPALAQPQDAARVVSGQDIVAWRALPQDDAQALRGFIQEYPSSPLAERAFTQLQVLDQEEGVLSPAAQRGLASSADTHYRALSRASGSVSVATLNLGAAPSQPASSGLSFRSFQPRAELGAATWGTNLGLGVGAGLQGQYFGAMLRTRWGDSRVEMHLAARVELPIFAAYTPYVELLGARRFVGADLNPWAAGGAVGASLPLIDKLGLQASAEYWNDSRVGLYAALRYSF